MESCLFVTGEAVMVTTAVNTANIVTEQHGFR